MSSENLSPTVNTPWFLDRLASLKMSQTKFGELMGLDKGAVSLLLRGRRKMSVHEAGQIAGIFHVPVDEVLRHAGVDARVQPAGKVKVAGWIDAEGEVHHGGANGPKSVSAPPGVDARCEALRAQTGGPFDGWLLFYRPTTEVSPDAIGRMCIVRIGGRDSLLVRVVGRGYEAGYFTVTGWTGGASENVRLESAAPVLWMQQ